MYCTTEEYEREKSFLEDRFQKNRTIARIRSLHAFITKSTDTMTIKRFSLSTTSKDMKVMKERGELEMKCLAISSVFIVINGGLVVY